MKFKSALKYQISGNIKPLVIFYIVICAILVLTLIAGLLVGNGKISARYSGMEMASAIFIFVVGLNSFKSSFHMLLVNGGSRNTVFKSFTASILPIAAAMSLVDNICRLAFSTTNSYDSLFYQLYHARYSALPATFGSTLQVSLEGFLWAFFLYAAMAMAGYFITTLFYRMNRPLKLSVSIGVPVLLFVVLPVLDVKFFHGEIFKSIGRMIFKALGFLDGSNPYIALLSCTIAFALFGLFSYLLMRRATIKE